jgi:competence protein ComFA
LLNLFADPQERKGKLLRSLPRVPRLNLQHLLVKSILKRKFALVKKELAAFGEEFAVKTPPVHGCSGVPIDYFQLNYYQDVLESILQGRIFYLREINRRLRDKGIVVEDLESVLHLASLKGQIIKVPAVQFLGRRGMVCSRCGQQYHLVRKFCNEGKHECYYCQGCLKLSEAKPCNVLYALPARPRPEESVVKSVRLNLDITFSLAQYEAFESLARFVRKDSSLECLVWEACGAGRPETVFGAVREVLKRGGRVLFGVPRKDLIEDLSLRLERAFPGIAVSAQYGKSGANPADADITLASTHHALKYYKNFDLVILDESSAFPARAGAIMINALRRAKKNQGKLIYLTPTPDPEMYARAQRGDVKVIQIPIRQHRHPLAVPRVMIEQETGYENRAPEILKAWSWFPMLPTPTGWGNGWRTGSGIGRTRDYGPARSFIPIPGNRTWIKKFPPICAANTTYWLPPISPGGEIWPPTPT